MRTFIVLLSTLALAPGCKCAGEGPGPLPAPTPEAAAPEAAAPEAAAPEAAAPDGKNDPRRRQPLPPKFDVTPQVAVTSASKDTAYRVVELPVDSPAVEGTIRWKGAPPAAVTIQAPEDAQDLCGPELRHVPVSVDSSGGVGGAFVRLVDPKEGKRFPSFPEPQTLYIRRCAITPRAVTVQAGGIVRIHNLDTIDHAFVARRGKKKLFEVTVKAGAKVDQVVKGEGFVGLRGTQGRAWMRAWVLSSVQPYVTATEDGGSYRIGQVKEGAAEVEVWHPPLAKGGDPLIARRTLKLSRWAKGIADFTLSDLVSTPSPAR